jgi:hypothetical protein
LLNPPSIRLGIGLLKEWAIYLHWLGMRFENYLNTNWRNGKLSRLNKTEKNLKTVWQQLDNASGELYNALDNLARMTDLPETIKRQADMIDITRIDGLKQEIETLLEQKGVLVCD